MENKQKEEFESVSYMELARRVGDCILNNEIQTQLESDGDYEFEVINGEHDYCYIHETKEECEKDGGVSCEWESIDVYQTYIISQSGAEYLQRNTNEIVYHCEKLDLYLWGITHFGTSWDGVFTNIKAIQ